MNFYHDTYWVHANISSFSQRGHTCISCYGQYWNILIDFMSNVFHSPLLAKLGLRLLKSSPVCSSIHLSFCQSITNLVNVDPKWLSCNNTILLNNTLYTQSRFDTCVFIINNAIAVHHSKKCFSNKEWECLKRLTPTNIIQALL